jgi:hypothetical protein
MIPVKRIAVSLDSATGELTPDQIIFDRANGEVIQWDFPDAPDHLVPHIYFHPDPGTEEHELFGPFEYLEPSPRCLIGMGNFNRAKLYRYTLLLLDETSAAATSGPHCHINNLLSEENTSPDALVTFDEEATQPFKVIPPILTLEVKRTAIWYIKHVPPGFFVTFRFPEFQDQAKGPFLSFSLSRGFNGAWLANGAGFLWDRLPGQIPPSIHYRVTLRNAAGDVEHVHDPVIEPLGPPISSSTE